MSNILLDSLPETVKVGGRDFFIDTDFRTLIILEKLISDKELSGYNLASTIVDLMYSDEKPADIGEACEKALYIYSCGTPAKKVEPKMNGNVELTPPMIYDFEYDAPYIYGAFMSQYGIDLNEIEYLHWWKFVALFKSLNNDNKIVEIMGYRATDLSQITDDSEKKRISKLKSIYALPDQYTPEEKVAMAGAAFAGGYS